jgi:NADPH-dependent 7-cyano-7-deazaguanine reductase QueF
MLKTQPNERRCGQTTVAHLLAIPPCCPISGNPLAGSTLRLVYIPMFHMLEVGSLRAYVDSYQGGRGDVRSMEGMIQNIAQDCANCIGVYVKATAELNLSPLQQMTVGCLASPVAAHVR